MDEKTRSGALDPSKRELILAMVGSARTLPPAERAAWLDGVCGVDSALRAELESLLADSGWDSTTAMSSPVFDVAAVSSGIVPGQTLGQYRIVEKLGQGGMGAVYKALDQRLGRSAAVKVITYSSGTGVEKRRFFREAQAASALNHPNIVTIYEYNSDRGMDYMAMEYIQGKTLARLMDDPDLQLETRIGYACQVAAALGKAHEAGIVHRDLKPANIMVTGDGQVKVLDFGLARQAYPGGAPSDAEGETMTGFTAAGAVMGTPAYMSPEQAIGERLDHCSDIFSFGIVLYELLCGRHPFRGTDHLETLNAIVRQEPASAAVLNPAIPPAVSAVIERCLRKDRAARPQSATGIRTDLLAAWDSHSPGSTPPRSSAPEFISEPAPPAAKARRFRAWMLAPAGLRSPCCWQSRCSAAIQAPRRQKPRPSRLYRTITRKRTISWSTTTGPTRSKPRFRSLRKSPPAIPGSPPPSPISDAPTSCSSSRRAIRATSNPPARVVLRR